jgi:hypothetical protein
MRGAGEGNRTPDLLITSEPLCRLSYPGVVRADCIAAPAHSPSAAGAFFSRKLSRRVDFLEDLRWSEARGGPGQAAPRVGGLTRSLAD